MSTIEARQFTQKTVKAFEPDIALINKRAKFLACSAADVIHEMCRELRKQVYLQELGESFDLACSNGEQIAAFEEEHKLWDCALSDGLNSAD